MISFKMKADEIDVIERIAIRALDMQAQFDRPARLRRKQIDFVMDLAAANNAIPIRLEALLEADDFNFSHDVFGIERHLDRVTGEIGNHFRPRYAKREEPAG